MDADGLTLTVYGKTGRRDAETVLGWLEQAFGPLRFRRRRNQESVWWTAVDVPGGLPLSRLFNVSRMINDRRVRVWFGPELWRARWPTPLDCAREVTRATGCVVEYVDQGEGQPEVWAVRPLRPLGEEILGPGRLWGSLAEPAAAELVVSQQTCRRL
jgi:hypothetical protein